mgnify:FL=1
MIVTKEQQQALIDNYAKKGYSIHEVTSFMDGVIATMDLITKIDKNN